MKTVRVWFVNGASVDLTAEGLSVYALYHKLVKRKFMLVEGALINPEMVVYAEEVKDNE